jgi:hypothetical protein
MILAETIPGMGEGESRRAVEGWFQARYTWYIVSTFHICHNEPLSSAIIKKSDSEVLYF